LFKNKCFPPRRHYFACAVIHLSKHLDFPTKLTPIP